MELNYNTPSIGGNSKRFNLKEDSNLIKNKKSLEKVDKNKNPKIYIKENNVN